MTRQPPEPRPAVVALARAVATAGGAGYAPVAPGTVGTAVAVPLVWASHPLPGVAFWLLCALVTAVGIWAADIADRSWGSHDNRRIVIDEVAGYAVALAAVDRSSWILLLAGFIVFRAFDMAKPPPVRTIDRRLHGGAGVVLDDVAAGLLALPLLWAMQLTGVHSHLAGW